MLSMVGWQYEVVPGEGFITLAKCCADPNKNDKLYCSKRGDGMWCHSCLRQGTIALYHPSRDEESRVDGRTGQGSFELRMLACVGSSDGTSSWSHVTSEDGSTLGLGYTLLHSEPCHHDWNGSFDQLVCSLQISQWLRPEFFPSSHFSSQSLGLMGSTQSNLVPRTRQGTWSSTHPLYFAGPCHSWSRVVQEAAD